MKTGKKNIPKNYKCDHGKPGDPEEVYVIGPRWSILIAAAIMDGFGYSNCKPITAQVNYN